MVKYLNSQDLLSEIHYGFRFLRSIAGVLAVISETIYQALVKNVDARAVAFNISKVFDRV